MIRELLEYSSELGIDAEPGFSAKYAKWIIRVDQSGHYLGVEQPLEGGKKGLQFRKAPNLTQAEMKSHGRGTRPFLLDTLAVVVLFGNDDEDSAKQLKHNFFTSLIESAAGQIDDLVPINRFLRDPVLLASVRQDLTKRADPNDNVTFSVQGRYVIESNVWHAWWREWRGSIQSRASGTSKIAKLTRCFATGTSARPVRVHEKITGLSHVGGLTTGDSLISFNQRAFSSFGLLQGENASMSPQAAKSYQAALNHAISKGWTISGVQIVHWFAPSISKDLDPCFLLWDGSGKGANRAETDRANLAKSLFFSLILSGASGRVMIRDFYQSRFEDVENNVARWFDDLAIVAPAGNRRLKSPSFRTLSSLLVGRTGNNAPGLITALWRAALQNGPLPWQAHAQILDHISYTLANRYLPKPAAFSLLKALYMRSSERLSRETGLQDIFFGPELTPNNPAMSYQMGRLASAIQFFRKKSRLSWHWNLQGHAYGGVFLGVRPGDLLGMAASEQKKMRFQHVKGRECYEKLLAEISARIDVSRAHTLSPLEQGIYALGYYQQFSSLRKDVHDSKIRTDCQSI